MMFLSSSHPAEAGGFRLGEECRSGSEADVQEPGNRTTAQAVCITSLSTKSVSQTSLTFEIRFSVSKTELKLKERLAILK